MLRRPLRRRAGFSLVEVLVAVFIVSAGLIALLTLFPLGAIQMGQALRDDRSQQCALQADGKIRELWRSRVVEGAGLGDPFVTALDDPDGGGAGYTPVPVTSRAPSYPVLFDPFGYASYTNKRTQVAQPYAGIFPRRTTTVPSPTPNALAYRYASLQDDMEFGPDGTPADRDGLSVNGSGQPLFRGGRFNYAAVIQRPDNSNRLVADLKILVFDRRNPGVEPADNELLTTGTSNSQAAGSNLVVQGDTLVTLNLPNDTLGLRVGSWIMDGSFAGGNRNAHFYRVTSVDAESLAAANQTIVELHIPLQKPRGDVNPNTAYSPTFYFFRELIDVYDRPQLAPSGYQKQTP